MEKLFIRILNRTLLVGCVLLLTGAVLIAITAGANYIEGSNPPVDHSDIIVAYTLLPPLPASPDASVDSSAGQVSSDDLKLMNQATAGCGAIGRIRKNNFRKQAGIPWSWADYMRKGPSNDSQKIWN